MIHKLTNFMEQSTPSDANSHSAGQGRFSLLRKPKIH